MNETELRNMTQEQLEKLVANKPTQTHRVLARVRRLLKNRQTGDHLRGILVRDDVTPHFTFDNGEPLSVGFYRLDNGELITTNDYQDVGL